MPNPLILSTTAERSALMSRVRQRGTLPELRVRQCLSKLGAHYRLNARDLPGRPDIVNRKLKKAIFVHGCFWHGHVSCGRGRIPRHNRPYWAVKLKENGQRDARKVAGLAALGYDIMIIWECELLNGATLTRRLKSFWFRS
jgi:DNA mismatch endonuclease Vsr